MWSARRLGRADARPDGGKRSANDCDKVPVSRIHADRRSRAYIPRSQRRRPRAAADRGSLRRGDADRQPRDVTLRALEILAAADADPGRGHPRNRGPCSPVTASRRRFALPRAQRRRSRARARCARIAEGEALALMSDAGTPLVSDPGYRLVAEAVALGIAVTAVPGASAALAALCVAGLPTDRFLFGDSCRRRSAARRERLNALAATPGTLVFYEAPRGSPKRSPTWRPNSAPAGGGGARADQTARGGPAGRRSTRWPPQYAAGRRRRARS